MNITEIPPITDPLGRYWEQPDRDNILIDDQHALMTREDFKQLHNYSASIPSGVYVGKMWKRKFRDKWYLSWYGPHDDPDRCSINHREIIWT